MSTKSGGAGFQWGNNEKEVDCTERIYKNNFQCTQRKPLCNKHCLPPVKDIGMMVKTDNLPHTIFLEED